MRSHRDVIIAPVVSEKSYEALDEGRYTFVVHPTASKTQIKQAIEAIFGVKVAKVNTMHRQGKRKRFGLQQGQRKHTKRAVVTLREGEELDIFEIGF